MAHDLNSSFFLLPVLNIQWENVRKKSYDICDKNMRYSVVAFQNFWKHFWKFVYFACNLISMLINDVIEHKTFDPCYNYGRKLNYSRLFRVCFFLHFSTSGVFVFSNTKRWETYQWQTEKELGNGKSDWTGTTGKETDDFRSVRRISAYSIAFRKYFFIDSLSRTIS